MAPERRYSRDHTWVERRDDGLLVGLTAYAVDRLGNLRHLLLTAAVGQQLAPGETFTVERASADHVTGKVEVIQTAMEVQKVAAEHAGAYGQGMRYVIEMFAAGGRAS